MAADEQKDDKNLSDDARRSRWRWQYAVVAVALATSYAGVAIVAASVADDSEEVAQLERRAHSAWKLQERETARASALAKQLDDADESIRQLELGPRGPASQDSESARPASSGFVASRRLGQAAVVGDLTIKPTRIERLTGGAGDAFVVTTTVKNNGTEAVSPFCGGGGALLVDTKGRNHRSEAVIDESSTACEDLGPGLKSHSIKFRFDVPKDAKPAVLRLWGDYDNEALAQTWKAE